MVDNRGIDDFHGWINIMAGLATIGGVVLLLCLVCILVLLGMKIWREW